MRQLAARVETLWPIVRPGAGPCRRDAADRSEAEQYHGGEESGAAKYLYWTEFSTIVPVSPGVPSHQVTRTKKEGEL